MKNLIQIFTDPFFICQRLKEIDRSYFVMFDLEKKNYQLHSSEQKGNSYCLTFPFDCLDARAVEHARKTRVENEEKIIEEIDRENKRLEKKLINEEINRLKEALE